MKTCSKCGVQESLSYHPYCYTCLRIARGQLPVPKFRRDCNNKTLCSRCKKRPKAKGHNYCSECRNAAVIRWRKNGGYAWKNLTKEQHQKAIARRLINNWLKRGKIKRLPCEVCGNPDSEFHHDDYSKPHQVRQLCKAHHAEADRQKELVDKSKSLK